MTPARPAAIVAVGGGHGLAASLRAIRRITDDVTAVVSVADDGGSTGRLRRTTAQAAPGDLRKCLVALAEPGSALARAMEFRFDEAQLDGHAFGNLLLTAMSEVSGGLTAALDEVGSLLGGTGRVLPATDEPVDLVADTWAGTRVRGQVAVMGTSGIDRVSLEPQSPAVPADVLDAIAAADLIVLGPGSLFTSVLAAAATPALAAAIDRAPGRLVYVCNLRPQDGETSGFGVADHVDALARHGLRPDVVLHDPSLGGVDGVVGAVAVPMTVGDRAVHDPGRLEGAIRAQLAQHTSDLIP